MPLLTTLSFLPKVKVAQDCPRLFVTPWAVYEVCAGFLGGRDWLLPSGG